MPFQLRQGLILQSQNTRIVAPADHSTSRLVSRLDSVTFFACRRIRSYLFTSAVILTGMDHRLGGHVWAVGSHQSTFSSLAGSIALT